MVRDVTILGCAVKNPRFYPKELPGSCLAPYRNLQELPVSPRLESQETSSVQTSRLSMDHNNLVGGQLPAPIADVIVPSVVEKK